MIEITLGNGNALGIDEGGFLIVKECRQGGRVIVLGRATEDRFRTLLDYTKTLSIHAVE